MTKLAHKCSCGYIAEDWFGVNDDGSCKCNDCTGLAYPRDGTFKHADFCRQQKEKKAAEEGREVLKRATDSLPAPTHDASGYPLPGKCVCGFELGKYEPRPKNGKCLCGFCDPSPYPSHYKHCSQKLKDRFAEQERLVATQRQNMEGYVTRINTLEDTITAKDEMLKVKDDRIKVLEAEIGKLKRENDDMHAVVTGAEHDEAFAKNELKKAKDQIQTLEEIITAYSKDGGAKQLYIRKLEETLSTHQKADAFNHAHYKKYRKWMINMIAARANRSACNLEDIEPFLSVFPELREPVIKLVVFARRFQAFSSYSDQNLSDKQRISSIRFAKQLEELDGAEHSPAGGSAPQSG